MLCNDREIHLKGHLMIGVYRLRGAQAWLGIDQRQLPVLSGLSAQTIQWTGRSEGIIRGNVDSFIRLIAALNEAAIQFIALGAVGGGGIRLTVAAKDNRTAQTVSARVV